MGSTGRCSKFSLYILMEKISEMRASPAKEVSYVNFKEDYFGFIQLHDYRFFCRL